MKDFTLWDEVPVTVHLNAGENTLTVLVQEGDTANINLDRATVSREPMVMTQIPVPNGGFESGSLDSWTVDNLSETAGHGVDAAGRVRRPL